MTCAAQWWTLRIRLATGIDSMSWTLANASGSFWPAGISAGVGGIRPPSNQVILTAGRLPRTFGSQAVAFQDQPGVRQPAQKLGPERSHFRRHLGQIIEAGKGDVSGILCGERADLRGIGGRAIAPISVGHAQHALAVPDLFALANMEWVGQKAIHRRQTCRADVSEPG